MTPQEQAARKHAYYESHKDAWKRYAATARPKRLTDAFRAWYREWETRRPRRDRRAYRAAYYQRTKERDHVARQLIVVNRRARIRAAGGSFSLSEWLEKVALFAGCCIYCGERKPLTVDHNVPISRGGTNDISNILPACFSCNHQKNRKTAREYIAYRMAN